jgi:ribonuclease P protein component
VLPARHRLTSSADFRTTVRRGRRSGGSLLVTHLLTADPGTPHGRPLRVGFVVSRAVGPAVTRNLVKRRLRHLVRERLSVLPGSGILVVRALPAAAGASYAALGTELDRCLRRLRVPAGASR